MKLLEHEAKAILNASGVSIPLSEVVHKDDVPTLLLPYVIKSQVPVGGRGKAGGVVIADTLEESTEHIRNLFNLPIKGHAPKSLLLEEKLSIKKEFYFAVLVDRTTQGLVLMAHKDGGIEVEDQVGASFLTIPIDISSPDFDAIGQQLADYYNLPEQTYVLQDLVQKVTNCLTRHDALLIEINPLILTSDDKLIAGDAKITLDDAAAFRHPDWNFKETITESNFVTLNPKGTIATIANGAGLAMATVDAVSNAGLEPANFLDVGGGANTETLLIAFRRLTEYTELKAIVINIFAGITRADEVARAIVAAKEQITDLPPLFIRLAGTGYDDAKTILDDAGVALLPSLEACLLAAKQEVDNA